MEGWRNIKRIFDKVLVFAAVNAVRVGYNPSPFNFTAGTKGPS